MAKRSKPSAAARPRDGWAERRVRVLAGVALIVLLTAVAYSPCLRGEFIFDDYQNLTNNTLMREADGPYKFWLTTEPVDYWPVFNTTLWLEWHLWETSPTGYHVTNLALHIVTALLLWIILQRLNVPGAYLAALLFAVHPVNVESVAWITQVKNLLAMLFFLLSILSYLNAELPVSPEARAAAHNRWYVVSLVAFAAAMLSKGSVAVLPPILVAIVWWVRPLTRRDLRRLVPFLLISAVLVPVNVWFQSRLAGNRIAPAGFVERLLGAGAAVWFYLYAALVPINLSFVYPRWHVRPDALQWWLPLFGAAALTLVLWRHRRGRARALWFAWVYFCVSLVPVLGFTDVAFLRYAPVADHYQHIALIGVVALVAGGWATWQRRAAGTIRWAAIAAAAAVVGALTFLTWQQSALYASGATLYRDTLRKNPASSMVHNNLGTILANTGEPREAIDHFEQALQLDPAYVEAHNNLGAILANTGRVQEAMSHYEQALRLDPDSFNAHYNLGIAFSRQRQPREAIPHLRRAVQLDPDYAPARYNLGLVLIAAGDSRAAIETFQAAVRLEPDYAEAHNDLGVALTNTGHLQEAIAHFQQALRFAPDLHDAQYNLEVARAMEKGAAEVGRGGDEESADRPAHVGDEPGRLPSP
jgi:protein O-mannosyl-transferase